MALIATRVTEAERVRVTTMAERRGVTMSEFLRAVLADTTDLEPALGPTAPPLQMYLPTPDLSGVLLTVYASDWSRPLVTILRDATVRYGPGVELDVASRAFWTVLAHHLPLCLKEELP